MTIGYLFKCYLYTKKNGDMKVFHKEVRHLFKISTKYFRRVAKRMGYERFFVNVSYSSGLTDINGNRIFENDIVSVENVKYVVEWNFDNASFCLRNKECERPDYDIWGLCDVKMEILGNIYENENLIKKI